jgi:hypothetical protein
MEGSGIGRPTPLETGQAPKGVLEVRLLYLPPELKKHAQDPPKRENLGAGEGNCLSFHL